MNKEAQDAIKTIQSEFPKYANDIYLIKEGVSLTPADPNYSYKDPSLNKGVPISSDKISAFTAEQSPAEQKKISEAVGKDVTNKRVKQFTFYTNFEFKKTNTKIKFEDIEYEIIYIDRKIIQNTTILFKCIGVS